MQLKIKTPPKGFAVFAMIGPGLIWCSEMVGSGEVILTTRTGAILGTGVMWAIILGIFLKFWIGLGGARYTVCTGEGMIDMFDRIPGPKHWVVWIVLFVQFFTAAISIGSIAAAAGVFINSMIPVPDVFGGWVVSIFVFIVAWAGEFRFLKMIMSLFVLMIFGGIVYIAVTVFPTVSQFLNGLLFQIPEVPEWASKAVGHTNPWREILPLMGWAAGGFASQVWYTYWVLGGGFGAAADRGCGRPADVPALKSMSLKTAEKIRGWCRMVYVDATAATVITMILTLCFLIAGAAILGTSHQAPSGSQVAVTLSQIFTSKWGAFGGFLFMLTAAVALVGTQLAQLSGWPRLLADAFRICIPGFGRLKWKVQYRIFLVFFFITNIILVFTFGMKPVLLVKLGAVLDGLLLTPLQALWTLAGLYVVLPGLYSKEAYQIIRPHWLFAVFLILAFLLFGYFCIFQIPFLL